MSATDMLDATLWEAAAALASRKISSAELTGGLLQRIGDVDAGVRSFVTVLADQAMEAARQADAETAAGRAAGPLHGVPIAIKELYGIAGVVTSAGSKVRANHAAAEDCTVVARLRAAGAVILGTVTTHEFAFGFDSVPTRNPWNLDHIPSGSSGGSGAALAARLCFAATGSDTGGSIRAPASACGVSGIKPTYGRVSKAGVEVLSWSLDHAGPMARSARDLAVLLQVMAGHDPLDPHSATAAVPDYVAALDGRLRGVRVGVAEDYFFDDLDPAVATSVQAAIGQLRTQGAEVVPVRLPGLGPTRDAMLAIALAEAATYHQQDLRDRAGDYQDGTRALLETGSLMTATAYINAQRIRARIAGTIRDALADVDVLACPTLPTTALAVGQHTVTLGAGPENVFEVSARLCAPFNLSGLPAASIPCGIAPNGLPIGLQIAGRPFGEAMVLRVCDAFQQETDWHARMPPR